MIPLAFTVRLLREDSKSNKLAVLRTAWDWDGIVPNCILGQFFGRFLTQFLLNFVMANKKNVRVPKTVTWCNRPFPSFPRPLYQNEVKCSSFYMEIIFYFLLLIISSSLLYITLRGTILVYLDVPLSLLLPIYNVIQFKCCNFCFTCFFLCKSLSVTILLFSRYIYITMYQLGIGGINKIQ